MSPTTRRFVAILLSGLLLAFVAVPTATASPAQLKAAGEAGEQSDGYLGVPPGAPASARATVDGINAKRRKHYESIAKQNGVSVAEVAGLAGKKLIADAPSGQYVRGASGSWRKKP